MDRDAHEAYLTTQVMTATPQKLRLMLIQGAVRFATKALKHWEHDQNEQVSESLNRCRTILSELLCAVDADESEPARRTKEIYFFLYRTLAEAQLQHDRQKLADVVSVLEVERETWQQVCERMTEAPAASRSKADREITAGNIPAIPPMTQPDLRGHGSKSKPTGDVTVASGRAEPHAPTGLDADGAARDAEGSLSLEA